MDNSVKNSISRLYRDLNSRVEVRALIPMGYVAAMPVITVKNGQLVAIVPFLRYKVTGEIDRTLVFPIRYVLEYLVPECQVVGFRDLTVEPDYDGENFDRVIGFFRHDAVKHMDQASFMEFKKETLSKIDRLVDLLTGDSEDYTEIEDDSLRNNLQTIIEPFVISQYARLDEDFYNKYLKK